MHAAVALTAALALVGQSAEGQDEAPVARLTKMPVLTRFVEATYPPQAQEAGREGTVVLAIDVDAAGLVQKAEVIESAGVDFDDAALHAAAQFEFEPAEAGELGPVPVRITYRYRFVFQAPTQTSTPTANPDDPAPGPINFSGVIREAGSRAPIPFATVTVELAETSSSAALQVNTSTEADRRGQFALRDLPPGRHTVKITAPFFERFTSKERIEANQALEVAYFVPRAKKNPYEVVVRARAPRKEVARRTLELQEVRRVPGAQGDAIRVIQNMPGVARTPFGIGLLAVRGASPQDTGVFIDGQRVPILFHFGGLGGVTSVINSSILDQINFLPGGFGPEYGLASAGVVELVTREPRTDRVHGEAQIDTLALVPVNVSVFVEGPATEDPDDGSFVFSLRRSSLDGVLALALSGSSVRLAPRYYDYQARYDVPVGDDDTRTLTLFSYGSDDELVLLGAGDLGNNASSAASTESRTFFHRFNPRFTYRPDEDTQIRLSPTFGVDSTSLDIPSSGEGGSSVRVEARNYSAGLLVDSTFRIAPWAKVRLGGDTLYFHFVNDSTFPAFTAVRDFPSPLVDDAPTRRDQTRLTAIAASLYSELELTPLPNLTLWPGVRMQLLDYFVKDQPLADPRLVEGRTLVGVDPRVTARYAISPSWSIKAQAGIYRQPALPPQIYLNADLPMQRVQQYSGGFEWDIVDKLSLDIQGFYRFGEDIAQSTSERVVIDGTIRPVAFAPDAKNRGYGMELMLRLDQRWGLFGWIAYTLSRSEVQRRGQPWRPRFVLDQTHNLNVVAVYELGLNWHAGVRFRYVTGGGLPETVNRWYDADADTYDRRFGSEPRRAPPFHQLDIYVEKRWVFDQWYLQASLDVQNVYNATNTEFFVPTFDFKNDVAIPGLPVLPALGIKGVF